jgi:hypothetical protein
MVIEPIILCLFGHLNPQIKFSLGHDLAARPARHQAMTDFGKIARHRAAEQFWQIVAPAAENPIMPAILAIKIDLVGGRGEGVSGDGL